MSTAAVITTIGALFMGITAMVVREKAAKKPATVKKIILPPVFMSTGFLMFFVLEGSIPPTSRIIESVCAGLVVSIFLIKTTKFEIRDNQIYLIRSKAFIFILSGMLIIRVIIKILIGDSINIPEIGGMFFILAFSTLLPWRIAMYFSFKKIEKGLSKKSAIS